MNRKRLKISLGLSCVLIPWAWLQFNVLYFGHCHVVSGSGTVFHAHPFERNGSQSRSMPNHHHPDNEALLLGLLVRAVSVFLVCFAAVTVLLSRSRPAGLIHPQSPYNFRSFDTAYLRGPPALAF
ncbi:hypothetical protein JW777_08690 [bacterium]|nr:hypothetical protein [bacterium]